MVFSSVPFYLDPPSWNQQPGYQPVAGGVGGGGVDAHHLQPLVPPSPDGTRPGGAARPGSMAERARQAKVAQPEPGLKCPRCESTNTKFCYYNNYSLSQPRHFCKTCRRYWTRGGALRSVPVGGGCRRNKRSKSSSSKPSGATSDHRQAGTSASSATSAGAATGVVPSNNLPAPPQLPFMASMHLLPDYSAAASIRLNIAGMQALDSLDFQLGACPSVGQLEQWRLPQVQQYFPFMAGLDPAPPAPPSMGLFPFDSGDGGVADHGAFGGLAGQVHGKPSASGLITQLASVKMEENPRELSLPKQYLGVPGNDQYWVGGGSTGGGSSSGGGWTHLSGFNPPSTSNIL